MKTDVLTYKTDAVTMKTEALTVKTDAVTIKSDAVTYKTEAVTFNSDPRTDKTATLVIKALAGIPVNWAMAFGRERGVMLPVKKDFLTDEDLVGVIASLRARNRQVGNIEVRAAVRGLYSDFWKTVSAFANTTGGIILLGIDEKRRCTPAAGFDSDAIIDLLENGFSKQGAQIAPLPPYEIARLTLEGAPVVAVKIDSITEDARFFSQLPCHVKRLGIRGGSFKRVDDKDEHLSNYEIFYLLNRYMADDVDQSVVRDASLEDLDRSLVEAVIERLRATNSHLLDGDNFVVPILKRLNALKDSGTRVVPTLAGLLNLGRYPQQYFPFLFVDVTEHPTGVKFADLEVRFLSRKVCEGNLKNQIEDSLRAVRRVLKPRSVERGGEVDMAPEIPEIVLREAITNAVIHRDYSEIGRNERVTVDIFPDRVEIRNPGGLWGDRTVANLADGRSEPRNPLIAKTLTHVPAQDNRPLVENQGNGIRRMISAMQEQGLPAPQFAATRTSFTVILYRHAQL